MHLIHYHSKHQNHKLDLKVHMLLDIVRQLHIQYLHDLQSDKIL